MGQLALVIEISYYWNENIRESFEHQKAPEFSVQHLFSKEIEGIQIYIFHYFTSNVQLIFYGSIFRHKNNFV